MGRRPVASRPYRPFASQVAPEQPAPAIVASIPPTVSEPRAPEVVTPTPAYVPPAAPERETWETFLAESALEAPTQPIAERYVERQQPITEALPEQPAFAEAEPAVTNEVPAYADAEESDAYSYEEEVQDTVDVQAHVAEEEVQADEEIAPIEQFELATPAEAPQPRAMYQTPMFVSPASVPAVESLIDEVDAAFISAGLPSNPNATASDAAVSAAATLEAIARRLRASEIELRSPPAASLASEEATLATVLAALLANR